MNALELEKSLPPALEALAPEPGWCANTRAEQLNSGCFCITLDKAALLNAFDREVGREGFAKTLADSHPSLFSNVPVFVPAATLEKMHDVVKAVEAASRLPAYRTQSLSWAGESSQIDFGPLGALMGYDFHLSADGPRLIEVNTNAGGAFLNTVAARAQRACCAATGLPFDAALSRDPEDKFFEMFDAEWRRQRGSSELSTIAIVDDQPEDQYLFPEFVLAQAFLEKRGVRTVIADASDLAWNGTSLTCRGRAIDLVYNRLVDFGLDEPRHEALRAAYLSGATVLTPNPHVHALLADKRNLTLLSDAERLALWGLAREQVEVLSAAVPRTVLVSPMNADALWERRCELFFKPARGHASKAAYRGDKITRKVWTEVIAGGYVAQAYVAPSARMIEHEQDRARLKVDIRLYTYAGEVLLSAARLYRGQTTNMRTPGGGFAAVLSVAATDGGGA